MRRKLDQHLTALRRDGAISIWHDRRIEAGTAWANEVDAHIDSAQVILALVSPSFLASDYCYEIEMARALERHAAGEARVIPVILRTVDWQGSPLGRLQALPRGAKPIASWRNRDEAFADVARGLRLVVEELRSGGPQTHGSRSRPTSRVAARNRIWRVPHHRNPNFSGREAELNQLRGAYLDDERPARIQVLCGLAGVGKSQIALEYVYRNAENYSLIWWISADEPRRLASDFSRLTEELGLPVGGGSDQRADVESVRGWLDRSTDWLLVFDDARGPMDLRAYLPQAGRGHVLVTSRNPNWRRLGHPVPIKVPPRDDTIRFLLRRTGQHDATAADQLAGYLGDLPLALEQAGAYIERKGRSLSTYVDLFRSHQQKLIRHATTGSESSTGPEAVWELSFREIESSVPEAADLLTICAFLASDDVPLTLFTEHVPALPDSLHATVGDPLTLDDALEALRRFSLVEIAEDGLSIHALVQAAARDRLDDRSRRIWAAAAIHLVYDAFLFERNSVETWRTAARLLPHVLAATTNAEALGTGAEVTARLRDQAGLDLRRSVELARAKDLFAQAVAADEATFGPDHPRVAATHSHLAAAFEADGDLEGARKSFARALEINEQAYGPDDPTVATDAGKLAGVLRAQGDLAAAHRLYEHVLAIDEKNFGPDHPLVAADLGELGLISSMEADLAGARHRYERALSIEEAVYGAAHPRVGARIMDLAGVRRRQGDLAEARALYERALAIAESAYPPTHVTVAKHLLELAENFVAQDDLRAARVHYARAADALSQELGEDHPNAVAVRRTLASLPGRPPPNG